MKLRLYITLLFFFTTSTFAQLNNISIGGGIGLGSLMGNFPSQTTLGGKLFVTTNQTLKPFDKFQLHITYAQKVEKFLPGNSRIQYFPYITSFGLLGFFEQKLNEQIFVEEGMGLILLNDRSFDDIDTWNYGIAFNLFIGTKLYKNVNKDGIRL